MRTIPPTIAIAALAFMLAAPLATIANARPLDNDELGRPTTIYAQPNPALVQMEQKVYQADLSRQQSGQAAASVSQPSVAVAPK